MTYLASPQKVEQESSSEVWRKEKDGLMMTVEMLQVRAHPLLCLPHLLSHRTVKLTLHGAD